MLVSRLEVELKQRKTGLKGGGRDRDRAIPELRFKFRYNNGTTALFIFSNGYFSALTTYFFKSSWIETDINISNEATE